jgi:deoxyribonuclease-4
MAIKFGPAGLGGIKEAEKNLERFSKLGLKACEVAFTYGVYIKHDEDALRIGKKAKELGIELSIHAPYWINLNSDEASKRKASVKRILDCCKIGSKLGVEYVVFHSGFYGKSKDKEKAFENIKKAILEMEKEIKKNKWKVKLAPETMGKINVFGSIDEIAKLKKETGCSYCLDFAHILARYKKVDYEKIKKLFPEKIWHVHFSGIVYGEKGEKHHKKTGKDEWKNLLKNLPKDKDITIINESPDMINDSVEGLKILKKLNR